MTFLIAFASMFLMDLFYGFYTITTSERKAVSASRWAVAISVCNLIVAKTAQLDLLWAIPGVALGAYAGTWLSITLLGDET